jgi:hypothetical protein
MSKHTPSPWRYDSYTDFVFAHGEAMIVCETRGYGYLTSVMSDDDAVAQQDANGNLIAAAPDLLTAAKAVFNECDQWADGAEDASAHDRLCAKVCDMLRDVIRKAENES